MCIDKFRYDFSICSNFNISIHVLGYYYKMQFTLCMHLFFFFSFFNYSAEKGTRFTRKYERTSGFFFPNACIMFEPYADWIRTPIGFECKNCGNSSAIILFETFAFLVVKRKTIIIMIYFLGRIQECWKWGSTKGVHFRHFTRFFISLKSVFHSKLFKLKRKKYRLCNTNCSE